ncbi:MAG: DUF1343 domain-containing protein [Chlamydiia bacterium]|nr:DUF1343 domain-containing protein [Chlamydiia bacterium]
MSRTIFILLFCAFSTLRAEAIVQVGIERLLSSEYSQLLHGKRVGLISNQTGVDRQLRTTIGLMEEMEDSVGFQLAALFAPEHGIHGSAHSWQRLKDGTHKGKIPIFSLFGNTRRPTTAMLNAVDVFVFDIQDIGSRSYTYISTLFYVMEEAAKRKIPVIVADRPNPINGVTIDGPMLEDAWRSMVGYINVPYVHGMTIGELALFFNKEYNVGCALTVIPMRGWKRTMTFRDTGLPWIPTSPHIPESDSPLFYPATGILGEIQIANIGVGYTLPFKLVGAPWIDADAFAEKLNAQNFPGVHFQSFRYKPFYGRFKGEECGGVLIVVTDHLTYKPVSTQYLLMGMLKTMYPKQFAEGLKTSSNRKNMFCKVNGTEEIYNILHQETYVTWQLKAVHKQQREQFAKKREEYLIPSYS